jgi:hypothetical protein
MIVEELREAVSKSAGFARRAEEFLDTEGF